MKDPNYPTKQPKDAVADALTDRNSDPGAQVQDGSLKVHGDALRQENGVSRGHENDDTRPDQHR
jgi:hypothetical protein